MPPDTAVLEAAVQNRLDRGELAGRGPIYLDGSGELPDAEVAAQVILADAAHLRFLEHQSMPCTPERWAGIAADLVALLAY
jgi:hypothetical protein